LKTVVAGALGECVHVARVLSFLRLAEAAGWRTVFLGPAVAVQDVLKAARREKADLVGVSYRLTPETGERLLGEFAEEADDLRTTGVRFAFGGTPPVAERARAIGFFERVFDGTEPAEAVLAYLKGQTHTEAHHAATADDVIEACTLARRSIENALHGQPDMTADPVVQRRKQELIFQAQVTLDAIRRLTRADAADPLADPATLARAVTTGILDAPHLRNNAFARGEIETKIDARGACVAIDSATGKTLPEQRRMARILANQVREGSQ
jgi:methylmalonyl-CoA mutase cobalamin-binding subunit